jgi:hypothetical protein
MRRKAEHQSMKEQDQDLKAVEIRIAEGSFRLIVSRREWFLALVFAVLLTTLLAVPYALGHVLARPGTEFTGTLMNPEDSQSYFAKMLQGLDGRWLYTIPFTPEEHDPAFLGGFYLALGHLARWFGLSLVTIWHGARVVAGLFLFLMTFVFVATFFRDKRSRWTAYALALLGSGLGWILFLAGQTRWLGAFPVDFKMPEAHLLFSALAFPHAALGTALLLASFWTLLRMVNAERRQGLFAVAAGLVNLALGIVYPFLIFLVTVTIALYWLYLSYRARQLLWRLAGLFAIAFFIPAPLFLYYAYTHETNAIFHSWSSQAITSSPPWPHYLVSYGVLLLLALLPYLRQRDRYSASGSNALLWSWVLAAALLLYAPLNPQRRFAQGVHVPLAILATAGLLQIIVPWLEQSRPFRWLVARPRYTTTGLERLIIVTFLAFMSLSNAYLLADLSVMTGVRQPYPFFRTQTELETVSWVRANTERSAIVLGAYETGNYLAAQAGNPVVLGHWAETKDWPVKYGLALRFYDSQTDDAWRRDFLQQQGVSYVWFGPQERRLGDFAPDNSDYLKPVHENGEFALYAVR